MTSQRVCLTILALAVPLSSPLGGAAEPFDLLLEVGRIVDGTGNPWFFGDVAIRGDRIEVVGKIEGAEARRRIDCRGLVVAPGFIDIHSHSDMLLLEDGRALSKVHQGVTTEVLGEGDSVGPRMGRLSPGSVTIEGKTIEWRTVGEYLDALERRGISLNAATYAGQGTIWRCVMGDSHERPTAAQIAEMGALLVEALDDGAFGLSSMLASPPGLLATTADLVELSRVVARQGGLFSSHIRNEGTGVLDAVREAISVGEGAGVPVDIIHLKIADQSLWGRMGEVVGLIEAARRRGVDVQANVYPYTRGHNNLASIVPPWAHEGGREELLRRLASPEARSRIKREVREGLAGWYNHYSAVGGDWSRILVSTELSEKNRRFDGWTMDRVLAERGRGKEPAPDPLDLMLDFLAEENGSVGAIYEHHSEADMNRALAQPWCSIGSDGSAHATEGPLRRGRPHPRSFGTFPRLFGVYVRERGLLSLEEAVRKMTSLNAAKLGLRDRGILRPGAFADIAVFDPERAIDRATYVEPFQYAEGIEWVIVNGTVVLEKGMHTGARPGRALRKPRVREAGAGPAAPDPIESGEIEIRGGSLRAVITENGAHPPEHRAGYSGVAALFHGDSTRSLFVPAVSGLNFEHIYSGDASSYGWNIFEPRRSPMTLHRLAERRVELHQTATEHWPLESRLTYELSGELSGGNAIDFTVHCTPRGDAWKKHGYIGLFFASYIHAPEDLAIHFIGHSRAGKGDPRRRWIRHLSPKHGEAACHRPCGSDWDPPADPGLPIVLASGHSDLEYDEPFYYGVSHGKVLVMMFERARPLDPHGNGGETRFAQSPSGGGTGNPAWDFIFLKRGYEVGKEFQFRARAVYRDFNGRGDVLKAYEEWSGERVEDPGE